MHMKQLLNARRILSIYQTSTVSGKASRQVRQSLLYPSVALPLNFKFEPRKVRKDEFEKLSRSLSLLTSVILILNSSTDRGTGIHAP